MSSVWLEMHKKMAADRANRLVGSSPPPATTLNSQTTPSTSAPVEMPVSQSDNNNNIAQGNAVVKQTLPPAPPVVLQQEQLFYRPVTLPVKQAEVGAKTTAPANKRTTLPVKNSGLPGFSHQQARNHLASNINAGNAGQQSRPGGAAKKGKESKERVPVSSLMVESTPRYDHSWISSPIKVPVVVKTDGAPIHITDLDLSGFPPAQQQVMKGLVAALDENRKHNMQGGPALAPVYGISH